MKKYEKWYRQIVENGLTEKLVGYERHHILPRSLGGSDDQSNLIYLTARQHFICHWLLTKIYKEGEEHWKMLNALRMMRAENKNQQRYDTKITSRVYAKLKEEYSKLQSERYSGEKNPFFGKTHTNRAKKKISQANTGEKNGAKQLVAKQKISESKLGKKREPFSSAWLENLANSNRGENNGMFGKTHSDISIRKMREKALGRKQSNETIAKKAEALKGLKREKKLCIHCNKLVAVNGYVRWHGDNCKARY